MIFLPDITDKDLCAGSIAGPWTYNASHIFAKTALCLHLLSFPHAWCESLSFGTLIWMAGGKLWGLVIIENH